MSPDEYCQDKAAKSGSSFYYSFMFLPQQQRTAIIAIYAFCREVDDVVDECSDINIARTKLTWWRDEIERLFSGEAKHPVTQALVKVIEQYSIPQEYFCEVIDGMEMDLDYNSYPSFKELSLYCHRVASIVGLISVEIFGYKNRKTMKYAHDLGMAFQLTNILRDVYEDAEMGRLYIPLDELDKFGITQDDIINRRMTEEMKALFAFQADRAMKYYESAFEQLPDEDRYTQRSGVIMAAIYKTLLEEIKEDGYDVLKHRVKLTPIRKLWIAWKTSRKEKQLYKKLVTVSAR
ncbi:Phytoene synthase [hydrothermal vent metagenome]|uniref:Phytoene synthase n=1 Tax=hydrothermal vent metagenome TaxID=652676 RepID=A0A3B0ZIV7_9ZZZZ